jgi:hypothetical protein
MPLALLGQLAQSVTLKSSCGEMRRDMIAVQRVLVWSSSSAMGSKTGK